jgi:class 3 adenylate cyclase/tetratricopeptide (TPR) repeat protein
MTCSSCGAVMPADARFCASCGHQLVARPDERRVATVLFADLVGFTSLSEREDPEQVKNLVDRCFERLAADITAFGGQVDKVLGDALVALFGAPVAHEDDAERAVRAALRMQHHLEELRDGSLGELRLRIGINTGEVLTGALRAGGDYTAMGDVMNIASRLQSLAAPGQVVVGPSTYAAAQRGVRYEPLGPVPVKGREEPVDAWVALEATAPPGVRDDRARAALVGRDDELTVLRAAVQSAIARRRAHLVAIVGEAGVGKSRLATEIGVEAECRHEAEVLTGHCIPYGETNVWWPIGALVAGACAVDPTSPDDAARAGTRRCVQATLGLADTDPEVNRITDGLLALMGPAVHASDVDPTRAREDALRAALTFLAGRAAQRPLVLVLSDLHWADEQLLDFLPRLLAHLATLPVVLLVTMRGDQAGGWSPPTGKHNVVHLNLDPLEAEHADAMLRELLPDAGAELLAVLRERSGGNPFFLEELVAMISDGTDAAALPATLRGLVAARLDRLGRDERVMLEDAAVVGSTGPLPVLGLLAGDRDGDPEPALRTLAEQDLLVIDGDEYAFRNELTRDVAYSTLTKAERARRHGALARLLAKDAERTGRIEETLDRLAYHFNLSASLISELGPIAGLPDDLAPGAVQFLRRAAERAALQDDWKTADRYLSHTLGLVAPEDRAQQLAVRLARARARAELRDTAGSRRDITDALRVAEELDDATADAAARTILGDVEHKEGEFDRSAATLDDAIARWRRLDDGRGLAEALRYRGMTDVFRGELDAAGPFIEEALEIYRALQDRRGEAWALQNLAWIAFVRGRYEEAEDRLDVSAAAFGELGDWGGVSWALGLLAWVRFTQGRVDEAERLADRTLKESRELGNRWAVAIMQVLKANISLWRGEAQRALHDARESREVFRQLGDPWAQLQSLAPIVIALNTTGRSAEAEEVIDESAVIASRVSDRGLGNVPNMLRVAIKVQAGAPDALAVAATYLGDLDEGAFVSDERRVVLGLAQLQHGDARAAAETLRVACEQLQSRGANAAATAAYSAALVATGAPGDALTLVDQAQPHAVTYADEYRFELARAFALTRLGDGEGGEQALARAQAIVAGTDSTLDQLVVQLAAAALWTPSDRARVAAAEARALADRGSYDPIGWERAFALMAGTPG